MRIKHVLAEEIGDALDAEVSASDIEIPDTPDHGDYAATTAMEIASDRDENPRELAESVVEKISESEIEGLERVEVADPGYLNFFVDTAFLANQVLSGAIPEFSEKGEKIIVEHTSPNPNKPLHMGTMRTAILGDTIVRIAEKLGYEVEVQNYINDLGRQSARTVYAYRNFLDEISDEEKQKKDDFWIGRLYSEAGQHLEENPDEEEKVQAIIQEIEEGDNETFELMTDLVSKSLHGQLQTAYRSHVFYNLIPFESDIVASGLLEKVMDQLSELDIVYTVDSGEDEGCLVIDLSAYEEEMGGLKKPYKILKRSDGTATYTAKDIAFTLWKFGAVDHAFGYSEFDQQPSGESLWRTGGEEAKAFGDADYVINVVGAPQKYPMKVIKYALKALGYEEEADRFSHMHFKFVYLPGRVAYSGRKGNWVGKHGDAVLERAEELAREEVEERHSDLSTEQQDEIARKVSIAAVRYFLLKYTREKEIDFSFEDALDWEGDSGPYLLYATARAHGILKNVDTSPEFTVIENESAYHLLRTLEEFPTTIEKSFEQQEPANLVHHLKELSEQFNQFYHDSPVVQADSEELKRSRLALVQQYADVMEEGLNLLGIDPLEEM